MLFEQLTLILPLITGGNGIVTLREGLVNQEVRTHCQPLRSFRYRHEPIPAACYPTPLGASIPRTIRGGNGGTAAIEPFGGACELPLFANGFLDDASSTTFSSATTRQD